RRRLLPHGGVGEKIICVGHMQKLLGEAALGGRGLEIIFVLGKVFSHSGELPADVVPRVEYDLGRRIGRLDGSVFFHGVLSVGGTRETCREQGYCEKQHYSHLLISPLW